MQGRHSFFCAIKHATFGLKSRRAIKEPLFRVAVNMQCVLVYANIGLLTQEIRGKNARTHLEKLATSVENLVHAARPDIVCMCEVGSYACTRSGPLTESPMKMVIETCRDAWVKAMDCELGVAYLFPHPYLTLYNKFTTDIREVKIVHTYLGTGDHQRFAQLLSCTTRGSKLFDVWNIHNPCPKRPYGLTDKQREASLTTILRTTSLSDPEKNTWEAATTLGGDMNITEDYLCSLLDKFSQKSGNVLRGFTVYKPKQTANNYSLTPENSPDFCLSSLHAKKLDIDIHFPVERNAHIPYGICIQCEPPNMSLMLSHMPVRRWSESGNTESTTLHAHDQSIPRRWQKVARTHEAGRSFPPKALDSIR